MVTVTWNKCDGDKWCSFENVNLSHEHFNNMAGVYVIWHGGTSPKTVRVGQGNIAERIAAHRQDPQITKYASLGLFVTWAKLPANQQSGVEAYLAATLNPLVGNRFPNAQQIQVNSPFGSN